VLDGKVHSHVRRWLELPISSCVNEVACLPTKMCGLDLQSVQSYALNLRFTVRSGLKHSLNTDIRQVWSETTAKNVVIDSTSNNTTSLSSGKKLLLLSSRNAALKHLGTLQLQGLSITSIINHIDKKIINPWRRVISSTAFVIFCFVRKALI